MEHPDYYKLRAQLIEFLEVRAHHQPSGKQAGDDASIARHKDPQPAAAGT